MIKTKWLFYTYNNQGEDIIISIFASSREEAFDKFDYLYGEAYPIDFAVEAGYQYEG